jgi:arsenate reductase
VVRLEALQQLQAARVAATGLRSKSWDEFSKSGAPTFDFIFTVCDDAAKEVCPVWPGHPMTAHWGIADPAVVTGNAKDIDRAFRDAFVILDRRINLFLSLPLSSIDKLKLQNQLDNIGHQ